MNNIKNAKISAMILDRMSRGESIQVAIDAVLGAGSYTRIAGEAWEAFRGQTEAAK